MPINEPPTIWETAQKKCWVHIEVATSMMKLLDVLKDLQVLSVIPVLSDTAPTLMITPDNPDDLISIRALTRCIKSAAQVDSNWVHTTCNNEWMFRLFAHNNITIDVMTRLPSTAPKPVEI